MAAKTTVSRGKAKFAGVVEIKPPTEGDVLGNGTHIVLSLVEVSFGKIPDPRKNSEIKLELGVQTTDADGETIGVAYAPGLFYYARNNSRLNLSNLVVYDGPVHQHLSIDSEITEVEMAQMSPADVASLAQSGVDALGLAASVSGGTAAIVDAIPSVIGGILKLNGNDQVLKFGTSLYTREVNGDDGTLRLREGLYTVSKFKTNAKGKVDRSVRWVTVKLMVSGVTPTQLARSGAREGHQ